MVSGGERLLYNGKQEEDAVLSVQTEMKFFDFLMTPDGGGSERLMGKYFHNMFVLHISSKHGAGGNKREWGSVKMWIQIEKHWH